MNIEGIDRFLRRYNQASQQGSKDFHFTMQQAGDLAASINDLLLSHAKLSEAASQQAITISVDGGTFG